MDEEKKLWYIYEMLFIHKKEWNLVIYNNMDWPEGTMLKQVKLARQRKDKIPCDLT